MPGSLLYGAGGQLVYGSTGHLLYKPRPPVTITPSALSAYFGEDISAEEGWSETKYNDVTSNAENDFDSQDTLTTAGYQDLASGLCCDIWPAGQQVAARRKGLRFTLSLSSGQKSRLSSLTLESKYVAWGLIGYRRVSMSVRELDGFKTVTGSMAVYFTADADPFDDGADLAGQTPDLSVDWSDLNDDQDAAGGTLSSPKWLPYKLSSTALQKIQGFTGDTIYMWLWARNTTIAYQGDKGSANQTTNDKNGYGWEVVCGPVNGTMFYPSTYSARVVLGQDA
jgi:hypothetical protein